MSKLIPIINDSFVPSTIGYRFWCPACLAFHPLYTVQLPNYPVWWFNGNMDRPQFAPSLRMIQENNCHLYVSDGMLAYCNDCKHELRNQTIPMVEFDTERWCPMEALHTINGKPVDATGTQVPVNTPTVAASVATLETHREKCGNVGIVGPVCPSCGVKLE